MWAALYDICRALYDVDHGLSKHIEFQVYLSYFTKQAKNRNTIKKL